MVGWVRRVGERQREKKEWRLSLSMRVWAKCLKCKTKWENERVMERKMGDGQEKWKEKNKAGLEKEWIDDKNNCDRRRREGWNADSVWTEEEDKDTEKPGGRQTQTYKNYIWKKILVCNLRTFFQQHGFLSCCAKKAILNMKEFSA